MKDFDKIMIERLGVLVNIDKTIQELQELTEKLRDFKIFYFTKKSNHLGNKEFKKLLSDIQEERVDVSVMLKRIDKIFNFDPEINKSIAEIKKKRALSRVKDLEPTT